MTPPVPMIAADIPSVICFITTWCGACTPATIRMEAVRKPKTPTPCPKLVAPRQEYKASKAAEKQGHGKKANFVLVMCDGGIPALLEHKVTPVQPPIASTHGASIKLSILTCALPFVQERHALTVPFYAVKVRHHVSCRCFGQWFIGWCGWQKLEDLEPFGVDAVPHLIAVDDAGKVKESPSGDPFNKLKISN